MNSKPKNDAGASRRQFLTTSAASVVAVGASSSMEAQENKDDTSKGLPITIAGYPYERVRAIQDGRVKVDKCQVKFEVDKIGDLNRHVFNGPKTRDVTEVGLIPFLLAFCNGGLRDYQLLPIFVLKVFRHKSIFVHSDRGIAKPEDLRGRKVATVGYSSSGLTWIRGIIQDEYGIKPEEIEWVVTAKDSAKGQTGGASKWEKVPPPKSVNVTYAPEGKTDSDLLLEGKVDAIFHPAEPKAFVDRHPKVERLFSDPRKVESDYFKKTGIYPIMHIVAIRSELAKTQPWLPKAIFDAYSSAKQSDYDEMRKIRWAYSSLPWFGQEFRNTVNLMGDNFYSYGIKENRKALETVFRYLHQQGLSKRELTIDELFAPATLDFVDNSAV